MAKVTKDKVFESLFKPLYKTNKALEVYYLTREMMDGKLYMKKRLILNPGMYCEASLLYPDDPDYELYEGYLEIGFTGSSERGKGSLVVIEPFTSWKIEELKKVYDFAMSKFRNNLKGKLKMLEQLDATGWDESLFEIGPDNRQKGWSLLELQTE